MALFDLKEAKLRILPAHCTLDIQAQTTNNIYYPAQKIEIRQETNSLHIAVEKNSITTPQTILRTWDINFLNKHNDIKQLEKDSNIPLLLIGQKAQETLFHPEIHYLRSSSREREFLSLLAQFKRPSFLVPPGKNIPTILIVALAILSSFTMADTPLPLWWLIFAMSGAGLLNMIGGMEYPGIAKPWESTDSYCNAIIKFFSSRTFQATNAGVASAISPAILTAKGVTNLGYPPALGFAAMIANFLLSSAFGTVGIWNVKAIIKDFYYGGYSPKIIRETEILIYALLALLLTSARAHAVGELIYTGNEWKKTLEAYGLATLVNIPETLMFITAYVGLRIRIHEALITYHFPKNFLSLISSVLAILFAISFFMSFSKLTESAWRDEYNKWFNAKGVHWLNSIMSYGGGVAAACLVGGEGATIQLIFDYFYQLMIKISNSCSSNSCVKIMWLLNHIRARLHLTNVANERTPLLPTTTPLTSGNPNNQI